MTYTITSKSDEIKTDSLLELGGKVGLLFDRGANIIVITKDPDDYRPQSS